MFGWTPKKPPKMLIEKGILKMIRELTPNEQNKLNFNRILHNLGEWMTLEYLGNDFDILEMDKIDIRIIENGIKECDKENSDNQKWLDDRQFMVNQINLWCDIYRCASLVMD